MIGKKVRKPAQKYSTQNGSFSYSQRERNCVKNSDLVKYLDLYLLKSKPQILPQLERKIQKAFPIKLLKPMHTLYAPFQGSNESEMLLNKVLGQNKRKTPVFSDMRRMYHKPHRRHNEISKSHDDNTIMYIQGIADTRPKSVMNNKVSFIMQTDDL